MEADEDEVSFAEFIREQLDAFWDVLSDDDRARLQARRGTTIDDLNPTQITWWVAEVDGEEKKFLATRNAPETAVARMRAAASRRDELRERAGKLHDAQKEAERAATEARDALYASTTDYEIAEQEVVLLLRDGLLPEVPRG